MLRELRVKLQMLDTKKKTLIITAVSVFCVIAVLIGSVFAVPIFSNIAVCGVYENIRSDFDGGDYDCILVLGAGLRSDGSPSDMLADRLKVAIDLYQTGVSEVILLSGDYTDENYDEVSSMERYCLASGVPAEAIVKDGAGYSTYESMLNAKNSGKYDKIIVVTQKYHLYRALYIAEGLGMTAHGADAALRNYRGQIFRELREVAARTKDFFMVMLYEG